MKKLTSTSPITFEGNYGQYIEDLRRRKGADQPHRIKFKPLVR